MLRPRLSLLTRFRSQHAQMLRRLTDRFQLSTARPDAPTWIGQRVYESRPDLRDAFPLGLTPHEREAYAGWLFEHGRPDLGLQDEEILAYLDSAHRDPSHGLAATWLLSPVWQQSHPDALSVQGWSRFKTTLAAKLGIQAHWVRLAKLPKAYRTTVTSSGVNILAHFRYPSGLQVEAEEYAASLRSLGERVSLRDAPLGFTRVRCDDDLLGRECHDVTLAKLGVCESFDDQYSRTGWHSRRGVYRIACWSWELEYLPRELAGMATLADEIWTPSEFCATAVRTAFPEKPVTAMLPSVSLPKFVAMPRSYFGLPSHRRLFLFAFDIGSVMERKNPLGLIAAFRRAFRSDDRVHLAIKVTRGKSRPHDLARLRDAAAGANVSILDQVMPRTEMAALMAAADAYVSLHRAEGFGYTIAEAMLLGKPVVATGYSANIEFMSSETALTVRHELVPVGPGFAPYPVDAYWAQPDLDHAAELLRTVHSNFDDAQSMGQRAKQSLLKQHSPEAAGRRMLARIQAIRKLRA